MRLIAAVVAVLISCSALADTSVQAIALFNDKAMLSVNGAKAKIIVVGEVYKGVKLIKSNTDHAVVSVQGKEQTLTLSGTVLLSGELGDNSPPPSRDSAQIFADHTGFFRSSGRINGKSIQFLVDTGANIVVLSSRHADRVGLDYLNGTKGYATTASGVASMYKLTIDKMSFEGIEIYNVEAGVIEGSYPSIPLLGMSFLQRLDMNRSGNMMTLKKRY